MANTNPSRRHEIPHCIVLNDGTQLDVLVTVQLDGRDAPASWCKSLGTWDAPEYREVEIVSVRLDEKDSEERMDLLPLAENDRGVVDSALEAEDRDEESAWEDEQERRADAARDDRRCSRE